MQCNKLLTVKIIAKLKTMLIEEERVRKNNVICLMTKRNAFFEIHENKKQIVLICSYI